MIFSGKPSPVRTDVMGESNCEVGLWAGFCRGRSFIYERRCRRPL